MKLHINIFNMLKDVFTSFEKLKEAHPAFHFHIEIYNGDSEEWLATYDSRTKYGYKHIEINDHG